MNLITIEPILFLVSLETHSMLTHQKTAQQAFAAHCPSPVFIEVALCTLGLLAIEGCVAAVEMQALGVTGQ